MKEIFCAACMSRTADLVSHVCSPENCVMVPRQYMAALAASVKGEASCRLCGRKDHDHRCPLRGA